MLSKESSMTKTTRALKNLNSFYSVEEDHKACLNNAAHSCWSLIFKDQNKVTLAFRIVASSSKLIRWCQRNTTHLLVKISNKLSYLMEKSLPLSNLEFYKTHPTLKVHLSQDNWWTSCLHLAQFKVNKICLWTTMQILDISFCSNLSI